MTYEVEMITLNHIIISIKEEYLKPYTPVCKLFVLEILHMCKQFLNNFTKDVNINVQ